MASFTYIIFFITSMIPIIFQNIYSVRSAGGGASSSNAAETASSSNAEENDYPKYSDVYDDYTLLDFYKEDLYIPTKEEMESGDYEEVYIRKYDMCTKDITLWFGEDPSGMLHLDDHMAYIFDRPSKKDLVKTNFGENLDVYDWYKRCPNFSGSFFRYMVDKVDLRYMLTPHNYCVYLALRLPLHQMRYQNKNIFNRPFDLRDKQTINNIKEIMQECKKELVFYVRIEKNLKLNKYQNEGTSRIKKKELCNEYVKMMYYDRPEIIKTESYKKEYVNYIMETKNSELYKQLYDEHIMETCFKEDYASFSSPNIFCFCRSINMPTTPLETKDEFDNINEPSVMYVPEIFDIDDDDDIEKAIIKILDCISQITNMLDMEICDDYYLLPVISFKKICYFINSTDIIESHQYAFKYFFYAREFAIKEHRTRELMYETTSSYCARITRMHRGPNTFHPDDYVIEIRKKKPQERRYRRFH